MASLGVGGERPLRLAGISMVGFVGPKRMDEWATAYASEFKFPVNARAWATLLRALHALGWAALAECKNV